MTIQTDQTSDTQTPTSGTLTVSGVVKSNITSDSTDANEYLVFVNATSGSVNPLVNSAITVNPNKGVLTGGVSGGTF